jgi:ubiquinone/menaquinone biosynthesis C-methylase UbiE
MYSDPPDTAAFEAFEASGWETHAAGYDAFLRSVTSRTAEAVIDAARVRPGIRLLDVGTGPGQIAGIAAQRGAVATGIDIAAAMIAIARQAWPAARFRRADAHDLPFSDASFDAVTGNFAILHLGRPEHAAAEFVRVLAPGGRVVLTVWDEPERVPLLGAMASALETCGIEPPDDIPIGPAFFRFSSDDELQALLEGVGCQDVTVDTLQFTHRVADAAEVWAGIVEGTVRTSALVVRQRHEDQCRIHDAFVEVIEGYRNGSSIDLPISVKLCAGTA